MKEGGISPTKTELDEAVEQIIAMEESADEQHDLEDGEKRDKMEGGVYVNGGTCPEPPGTNRNPPEPTRNLEKSANDKIKKINK